MSVLRRVIKIETIIKQLNEFIKRIQCDVELEFLDTNIEENNIAVLSFDKKIISIYIIDLFNEYQSLKPNCTIQEYFEIILCHELGHFKDEEHFDKYNLILSLQSKLKSEKSPVEMIKLYDTIVEVRISLEISDYKLGRKYLSKHLLQIYDDKNEVNIKSYKDAFKIGRADVLRQLKILR